MTSIRGTVYLVGAGPGAADLITVRGMQLLQRADIVFHDALIEPAMLDYCAHALHVPVGKRCGQHSSAQAFINKRLIDAAARYRMIVRLKGGDPMIFGRAQEEIAALESAGIKVEVIPGITAAFAAAATLKQSLTERGIARSVAFHTRAKSATPLPLNVELESAPLPQADTLVVYMGRTESKEIALELIAAGRDGKTPVCLLEAISTAKERSLTLTLDQLAQGAAQPWFDSDSPALLLIGTVFRDRLQHIQTLTDRRLYA